MRHPHHRPIHGRGAPRRTPKPEPRSRRTTKVAEDQATHGTKSEWPSRMWSRQQTSTPAYHPRPPPTQADTSSAPPCPQAAHQLGAEPGADFATADGDHSCTDDGGTRNTQVADDPQAAIPGKQVEEPADGASPPPPEAVDHSAHRDAATDPGPDTRAPPAASPEATDAASGAPCPQAADQPEAKTCARQTAEDDDRRGTEAGARGAEQAARRPPSTDTWVTD